jgi:hypothetical protein
VEGRAGDISGAIIGARPVPVQRQVSGEEDGKISVCFAGTRITIITQCQFDLDELVITAHRGARQDRESEGEVAANEEIIGISTFIVGRISGFIGNRYSLLVVASGKAETGWNRRRRTAKALGVCQGDCLVVVCEKIKRIVRSGLELILDV